MSAAHFDGTGATYFEYAGGLPVVVNNPNQHFYYFWIRPAQATKISPGAGTYGAVSSAKSDQSNGTWVTLDNSTFVNAYRADGSGSGSTSTVEVPIGEPYWDLIIVEIRDASHMNIWLNGNQDLGSSTGANRSINLGSGSPNTRIGILSDGTTPWLGDIGGVGFGTLNSSSGLTSGDRTAIFNAAVLGLPPTLSGGVVVNYYKLNGNGGDLIGGRDMTVVGSQTYTTDNVGPIPSPTRADLIQFVHGGASLRPELPTVTADAGPVDTSSWTNLASVEKFAMSYTNRIGQSYTMTGWHYIPSGSLKDHVLFCNGGHEFSNQWGQTPAGGGYNFFIIAKNAVANGYGAFLWLMPDFGDATGPGNTNGANHNTLIPFQTSSYTPVELMVAASEIAMNNLVNRYSKRSTCGLSGGAYEALITMALDVRFNRACISSRGIIASRRYRTTGDFEEVTKGNHWKFEEWMRLACKNNRRYWELHHPTDIFGSTYYDPTGSGGIAEYASKFFAPIQTEFPQCDIQARLDTTPGAGDASITGFMGTHAFYQGTWDNHIEPALSGAAMTIYYADTVRAGTAYTGPTFTSDNAGFADAIVFSPFLPLTVPPVLNPTLVAGSLVLTGMSVGVVNGTGIPPGTLTIDGKVLSLSLLHPTLVPGALTLTGYTVNSGGGIPDKDVTQKFPIVNLGQNLVTARLHSVN